MKNILLLTATIRPNPNQPQLALIDPQERLEDYKKALMFYTEALKHGVIDEIVFVDNSGFDLKCLSEFFGSQNIEWLSYYGLDYPSTYHRGYGEFKLVDYAFENSEILKGLHAQDAIWKITGRYVVKNLKSVIKFSPRPFDIYCEIKKGWLEMGVLAWSIEGYKQVIYGVSENFKSEMPPELILAQLIEKRAKSRVGLVTEFYWNPLIIGRRGTNGSSFQGKFTGIKYLILSCLNWLRLPFRSIEFRRLDKSESK